MERLKHFYQQTGYTCGPAALRIALHSMQIKKPEKELAKILKTTRRHGTDHKQFRKAAKKLDLQYKVGKKHSTISDLKKTLKTYKVIVCYFDKKSNYGHYAVVKQIKNGKIYLSDPDKGHSHIINVKEFKQIWHGTTTYQGWFFGIKK